MSDEKRYVYKAVPEDFDYIQYAHYTAQLDTEAQSFIKTMITERQHGWKSRAKLLIQMAEVDDRRDEMHDKLLHQLEDLAKNLLVENHSHTRRTTTPRDHLVAFLTSQPNSVLEDWAERNDVDYASFMKSNDRDNLIEAIADEVDKVSETDIEVVV